MDHTSSAGSRHFQLEQLADGVYAAIHADDGWAICNAGIIDLGDRTLVFDAFLAPAAASDLRDTAESLTGRPVHAVINSHPHNDHIWGNQAFSPDVDIISTAKTRELIATEGPGEVQGYRDVAQKQLEALQVQLAEAHDDTTRYHLKVMIVYFEAIVATLPGLQLRLPNLTFAGDLTFSGPKRSARLITFEGGHSESDAILHLPDDGIVFMSDLLFIGGHPYLADGDPDSIPQIMAETRKLGPKILVPGHGPVGQLSNLDWMEGYVDSLNALVREAIKNEASADDMDHIAIPGKYQDLIFPSFFPTNLKFLYKRQTGL
jgi:cyclase